MARRLRPAKDTHRIVCGQRSVPGNRSTRIQSRHRLSKELLAGIVANPHPRKAAIQTLLAARRIDSPAKPSGFAAERISYLAQPGQRNTQQDRQTRTASNLKPYVFTPDSGSRVVWMILSDRLTGRSRQQPPRFRATLDALRSRHIPAFPALLLCRSELPTPSHS